MYVEVTWKHIYKWLLTTCINVSILFTCNFSIHNKKLHEDDMHTSKHVGML